MTFPAQQDAPEAATPVLLGFASFRDGTFELIVQNSRTGDEVTLTGPFNPADLDRVDRVLPTCVFVPALLERKP